MKKVMVLVSIVILVFGPAAAVSANSTPVYLEEYPSFSIAPMEDSPIRVDREELVFKVDERSSETALVTARYTLANASSEHQIVPMVFPVVSQGYRGLEPTIEFKGEAVAYQVFGGGRVDVGDFLKDPARFREQADIDRIIENLNQPPYQSAFFDDTAPATLYEVTFNPPAERQCRLSITMDPAETRVLTLGFNGLEIHGDGEGTVFSYINDNRVGEKGYLLVLGSDTLGNIQGEYDDTIEKTRVIPRDFILSQVHESGYPLQNWDGDNFYSLILHVIDRFFQQGQLVFSYSMLIENVFHSNNISALLFQLELDPGSTNTLQVTYPTWATIDRSESVDYVNTFAYLLNPARNFQEFGGMDIRIELNSRHPYIIDSSIPLTEGEPGIYTVSLDSLPAEDLVFSTYTGREITPLDRARATLLPRGYGLLFLVMGAPFFVGLVFLCRLAFRRVPDR